MEAATKSDNAANQCPWPMKNNARVANAPSPVAQASIGFLRWPRSAMAPTSGARNNTTRLASELPTPKYSVLVASDCPALHQVLKKTGKKPAITVVAKAELAQSYSAQAQRPRAPPAPAAGPACATISRNDSRGATANRHPRGRRPPDNRPAAWRCA